MQELTAKQLDPSMQQAAPSAPGSPCAHQQHQQGGPPSLHVALGAVLQQQQQQQQEAEDMECAEQEECADDLQDNDLQEQQQHAVDPCNSSTAALLPGLHSQVVFYRTSYKLSEQQVSLPRGIYTLPAGDHLPVQLYVAVHPQGWDSDQYVAERAASLAHLGTQDSLCHAASPSAAASTATPAVATGAAAAPAAAPGSTSATDGGSRVVAAAVDGDAVGATAAGSGSLSPHQGSCSPPMHKTPSASSSPDPVLLQHLLPCASRQEPRCCVEEQAAAAATRGAGAAAGSVSFELQQERPVACSKAAGLSVLAAAAAQTVPEVQPVGAAASPSTTGLAALAAAAVTASKLQTAEHLLQHSPNPEPEQQQQHTLEALAAGAQQLLWSADAPESWAQGFGEGSQLLGPFPAVAKAQSGPREGMARITRVQHGGRLKGIWHSSSFKAVLYEKVGVTLLVHLKPHVPTSEPPATSRQRKRKPAKMYSLPGEGYGHQIYPGSVTEVELNAKLFVTASGTIPLKLPKALVLSQFSTIASLPHVVPLDVIVDGVPAELTMQVQAGPNSSSSTIRVQREVKISQLPRHQAYCLSGLATAGLGAYVGYTVTRLAAPGAGGRIIMHLASPAAMAAAAAAAGCGGWAGAAEDESTAAGEMAGAAGEEEAAAAAVAAAGCGSGSEAAGCSATAAAVGSNSSTSTAMGAAASTAEAVPPRQQHQEQQPQSGNLAAPQLLRSCFATPAPTPAAVAAARRAAAAACLSGLQAPAMLSHRSFWLQRLSHSNHRITPAADQAAAAAATAAGSTAGAASSSTRAGSDETAAAVAAGVADNGTESASDAAGANRSGWAGMPGAAAAGCTVPALQAAALSPSAAPAAAPPAAAVSRAAAASSSNRLDMFKAILQRQQQQQQQALKQQQIPLQVQQQQGAVSSPMFPAKLAAAADAAAATSEDATHPASCSTHNCSSGSSDFTSCGLSSGAAAGGAPQADTPTSAHAAAANNAGAFAANSAAVDGAADGAAATAAAVSRKRGNAQKSRLGCGGTSGSTKRQQQQQQQQQQGIGNGWEGADALVAVLCSKRQKRGVGL